MCKRIRSILNFSLLLAVIVLVFLIRSDTSKNYFNEQLTQEEKNIFFYNTETNPLLQPSEIGIKCQMYQNIIMDERVTKLGDVFNLNIELIHDKTTALLILWISCLIFTIFCMICFFANIRTQNVTIICLSCCMLIGSFIFAIANFILLYKLILAFYYSDMNQFVQFLKCRNVVREGFSKYLYIEDLHYHIALFILCSIVQMGMQLSNNNNDENRRERNNNDIELANLN
jgi:hypothetical protein